MTTAIKRQGRHTPVSYTHLTHTMHVMSGLTHVSFLTFARFLNVKCRNPYQHNACKPKKCPAWIAICFLWIGGQCNCTCLQRNDSYTDLSSLANEHSARCWGSMSDFGALFLFLVFVLWNVHCRFAALLWATLNRECWKFLSMVCPHTH